MRNIGPRIEIVLDAKLKRLNPHRIVRECSRECHHQFRDGGVHIALADHLVPELAVFARPAPLEESPLRIPRQLRIFRDDVAWNRQSLPATIIKGR